MWLKHTCSSTHFVVIPVCEERMRKKAVCLAGRFRFSWALAELRSMIHLLCCSCFGRPLSFVALFVPLREALVRARLQGLSGTALRAHQNSEEHESRFSCELCACIDFSLCALLRLSDGVIWMRYILQRGIPSQERIFMNSDYKYKRVLLKLSGEALMGE